MMNQYRGHQMYMDPSHLRRERSTNHEWGNYRQFPRYPGQEVHGCNLEADGGWGKPSSSSQNWQNEEKDYDEDPDGQPYEPDEEDDPELARKRKELQVIEEQIMLKKTSIALKNVVFKTILPGLCSGESDKMSETLRDRVNRILQLRHPHRFGPKGPLVRTRKRSSVTLQHDHPLKRRVKSVLQQRFEDHSTKAEDYLTRPEDHSKRAESCEIPFLSPSPPPSCQQHTSPPKDESDTNQGFMRFLNILNKGVDIDKLSKIVNDDSDVPSTSKALPHSGENGSQLDSGLFDSPPSVKTKEEEERLNMDKQQKHLQNILESLGLSLEMDEMSRLADRTQERLYGRRQCSKDTTKEVHLQKNKTETEKEDQQQQDGREKYSPGHYTRSSSSSSSGSSISILSRSKFSSRSPKSRSFRSRSRSPRSRSFRSRSRSRSRSPNSRSFRSRSRSRSPNSRSFRSRSQKSRSFRSRTRSPKSKSFRSRSRSPKYRSFRARSYSRSPSPHRRWRSPETQNHKDQTFPPLHPYAYSSNYSSSTQLHFQMYPTSQTDAHSTLYNNYLQYASYYNYQSDPNNYWAYNHPSISASNNINVPLTSANSPKSLLGLPPGATTNSINPIIPHFSSINGPSPPQRCLVEIKRFSFANPLMRSEYLEMLKTQQDKKAYNKFYKKKRKLKVKKQKEEERRKKELQRIISLGKQQPQKLTKQASKEQASQAEVNQAQASQAEVKQAQASQAEVKQTQASQAEVNQAHASQAHASQAQASQAHASQAHVNQAQASKEQASQAQATNQTAPDTVQTKKKKKRKVRVFVEDADRPERTDGPLTRAFTAKNPEKLSEFGGKLMVIEDTPIPPQYTVTDTAWSHMFRGKPQSERHLVEMSTQNQTDKLQEQFLVHNTSAVERTETLITKFEPGEQQEVKVKEEPVEKPVLTDEEIKANLKKKLEAFNNRVKQPFKSPAIPLTPKNNVEDEI